METGNIHGIVDVLLQCTIYCLDTVVIGRYIDMDSIYCGISNIMCISNGVIFHALCSTYDPMWTNSADGTQYQDSVVYTTSNLSVHEDCHMQLYKIDRYKQCMHREIYNGIIVHVSYKILRDVENKINVIIKSINNPQSINVPRRLHQCS